MGEGVDDFGRFSISSFWSDWLWFLSLAQPPSPLLCPQRSLSFLSTLFCCVLEQHRDRGCDRPHHEGAQDHRTPSTSGGGAQPAFLL